MMNNKKIVFLLASISQPRCIKRIKSFIDNGFDVDIYGIDREKYNINSTIFNEKINIIGKQKDGTNYFNKIFQNIFHVKKIISKYDKDNTIFYSFGFALTFALKINGCKKYIYEISDILYGYNKFNKLRIFFKSIDKYLIKKSLLTVLTSEGFVKFLFDGKHPKNILIQPNKLHSIFLKKERIQIKKISNNNLIFSFIGAFRYPNTVFRFAEIIGEKYPKFQFHFYGDSKLTEQVITLSRKYNNIKYFGAFKNPEDLNKIYDSINIVVACYDTISLNERIAEPNKLYESLFFYKPIIVSKNTFLSERVENLGCGYSIDASNDESIISFINSLNNNDLNNKIENIKKIDLEEIIDDNSIKIIKYINFHK